MIGTAPDSNATPPAPITASDPAAAAALAAVLAPALVEAARRLAAAEVMRTPPAGLLSFQSTARWADVSPKTLRAMVRRKIIPCVRVNSKVILFRPAAVLEALSRRETPARAGRR